MKRRRRAANQEVAQVFIAGDAKGANMQRERLNCLTLFVESDIRLLEDLVDKSFRWKPRPAGSEFLAPVESETSSASTHSSDDLPKATETDGTGNVPD